jgi:hypothetical protein
MYTQAQCLQNAASRELLTAIKVLEATHSQTTNTILVEAIN